MIDKIIRLIQDKDYRFIFIAAHGLYDRMEDAEYLKRMYRAKTGEELNLESPMTFNEKLQWLKLYDRKAIYTTMVDKYEVKDYVASIIGEEYIIPTLGVWDRAEDIDFKKLPNQFVLKCTHDSHGLVICRDKEKLDIAATREKLSSGLKRNYYLRFREWPYKNVKPRIIAEQYMEDSNVDAKTTGSPLKDYKIYTFQGVAKMCMINQDRGIHTKADYFDKDYNWLDFSWGYDHAETPPPKPLNYQKMFDLAEKLAVGTIELRVDFYEVNGKVYFGELTFFDGSGFYLIKPKEWDLKLGSWVKLPKETRVR